jgi:hypothetical protein
VRRSLDDRESFIEESLTAGCSVYATALELGVDDHTLAAWLADRYGHMDRAQILSLKKEVGVNEVKRFVKSRALATDAPPILALAFLKHHGDWNDKPKVEGGWRFIKTWRRKKEGE